MSIRLAYFCDTGRVKSLAGMYPELLLLPWEHQRAIGVVSPRDPMKTEYTFITHQWQTLAHPFPDLLQITEHLRGNSFRVTASLHDLDR